MITSPCGCKRAEEQNRLLTGMEKCASGVNSQAAARSRIVILLHGASASCVSPALLSRKKSGFSCTATRWDFSPNDPLPPFVISTEHSVSNSYSVGKKAVSSILDVVNKQQEKRRFLLVSWVREYDSDKYS